MIELTNIFPQQRDLSYLANSSTAPRAAVNLSGNFYNLFML
jgi:hypothetical protein